MKRAAHQLITVPAVYRAWQAPFADRKFAPILAQPGGCRARRVLDVGCGPGTNARYFAESAYTGIDLNPAYIESARRRYAGTFIAADVTTLDVAPGERFDFVLVNSLLHHLPDDDVALLLERLAALTSDDGYVHILELVRPDRPSIARLLAEWDRGDYARPLAHWRALFERHFERVLFEPYPLGAFGLTLWNMVYFKGRARR